MFSSSFAAAQYLSNISNFSTSCAKNKKVYVIGGQGILDELSLAKIEYVTHNTDNDVLDCHGEMVNQVEVDKDIGVVVVGLDVK